MSNPLLEVRDLHKSYQLQGRAPLEILHGIDFQIGPGECRPICGPSGAGKSTLLHILGGLENPDRGEILWKGESTRGWNRSRWAVWRRKAVGFVFQSYHLIPELTVEENVRLPAMLAGVPLGEVWEDLLDEVGMTLRRDHLPAELSGGEQQRVAVARALVLEPDLILADEPTGNLDGASASAVLDLLVKMVRHRQKSLLLVTHDETVAGRVGTPFRIADGRLTEARP
ncbi:MAG: ABC transporter ATP-binding protein [Verrucomicrobia bacterium]|nr:ABC transporter ATP-binding protein [bacterium]NDA09907.1 ABC transporter ATP-binding protein [Verrucomicrobiota bacterium]NDA25444.1 ABC transporter ATP-binding protein [Verrucomicrobiota bacterium]NDD56410.1 ABC transporter ATP-binding protein [Verrucomicrobiota bacterium]NDD81250.1 ABC transporter ATP-binding protein [Verrucomicrobiota bacterium]